MRPAKGGAQRKRGEKTGTENTMYNRDHPQSAHAKESGRRPYVTLNPGKRTPYRRRTISVLKEKGIDGAGTQRSHSLHAREGRDRLFYESVRMKGSQSWPRGGKISRTDRRAVERL